MKILFSDRMGALQYWEGGFAVLLGMSLRQINLLA